jgi:hypothetical protein
MPCASPRSTSCWKHMFLYGHRSCCCWWSGPGAKAPVALQPLRLIVHPV